MHWRMQCGTLESSVPLGPIFFQFYAKISKNRLTAHFGDPPPPPQCPENPKSATAFA